MGMHVGQVDGFEFSRESMSVGKPVLAKSQPMLTVKSRLLGGARCLSSSWAGSGKAGFLIFFVIGAVVPFFDNFKVRDFKDLLM
jgi:hypothetical protein